MISRRTGFLGAVILSAIYFTGLWMTASDIGYTRDEGYYFKAAEQYAGWWSVLFSDRFLDAFSNRIILKYFSYNTEHPPLVKFTQGWSFHLFHSFLGVAEPAHAFRVSGFFWGALSVLGTYVLGARLSGAAVGLFAAIALATLPRYFFDAHLACFDVAITAMWTWSLWAFHRALEAPPSKLYRRSAVAGLIFGLTLATKLNSFFLPVVFVSMWLVSLLHKQKTKLVKYTIGGINIVVPPIPIHLLSCAILGPFVLIAVWPYLWHSTFSRLIDYIQFHLRHEHYPISYFHELLVAPPFPIHFPWVMSLVTIPAPLLVLGVTGLLRSLRAMFRRSVDDTLIVVATLVPVIMIALPNSPIFGGVKHWYNSMPTFFIAGGIVFIQGIKELRLYEQNSTRYSIATNFLFCVMIGPGLLGLMASHPNGIGYYNALVGGFRGGAELGMQRGFWGGLAYPVFDVLPERGGVYFNRSNHATYLMYKRENKIGKNVRYLSRPQNSRAAIVFEQPEHAEAEAKIWQFLGPRPVAGTYADGVTLTQIYRRGVSKTPPKLKSSKLGR